MQPVKKVVLAYSGGLDTSIIIPWLIEHYRCEVIAVTADVGQEDELDGLEEKALKSGASKFILQDLKKEFVTDYIFPMVKSGAVYEGKYLLGSALARPLIALHQVKAAEAEGADAVSHGCTGKGNDQVRFELTYKAVNPKLAVIAPWRDPKWNIRSREEAIDYAQAHGIPVAQTKKKIFSNDTNLWHRSSEGGVLEDPAQAPPDAVFSITVPPEKAPDRAETIELKFESGVPAALNGERLEPVSLMSRLNQLGYKHGIGVVDMVENRLVGIKSRGVYETPGGTILYAAHREIESLVLDSRTLHYKEIVALTYAELIYYGLWFSQLRVALDGFIEKTQERCTGTVKLKLYKGNVIVDGRQSPYSLYREDFATFGKDDVYDQKDAGGFINCFGLPLKVQAMLKIDGIGTHKYQEMDYSKFKRD
ncbi:argininosuccinate synthase [bacterium]|nr:argininosuccinate synthase [bacterium]